MKLALAGFLLAGLTGASYAAGPPPTPHPPSPAASVAPAPRPTIVQDRIPFPRKRKLEMKRYARRHYHLGTYRLREPKVIVEHYTGGESYRSAYATFAADVPDVELHELPGLCAHFVIDKAGAIHQLVSLRIMCRHTVGLNWTAIGIEHVGTSDRQILRNRAQIAASLRLTRWLQSRFGIAIRNVIGHSESLASPYHRERVPALAHQTHGDFSHASMQSYRRRLGRAGSARSATPVRRRVHVGRSARGRPIDAVEMGDPGASRKVLVFGSIHGDETAGTRLARRLERGPAPSGLDLWIVDDLNPDGAAAHTRQNARGVDLNRNFPRHWRRLGARGDRYYSGPRPLSEPESRIARRLIRRVRPRITIWFHQPLALVNRSGGDVEIERRFAKLTGLPLRHIGPYPGTATSWQNHRFPGTTAFVVELPPDPLTARRLDRYGRAVLQIGRHSRSAQRVAERGAS
jgi:N-acetylmuramoyl-L-alanine amidase-like protein/zinc carboxypeptidase